MEDLRVPKHRVQVEVLLPGGAVRKVAVFLSESAASHSGPERLSDLLNGSQDFLPALDLETNQMTFLARRSIAAARVDPAHEPVAEPGIPTAHEVEVTLADQRTLRGLITYVRPTDRARLLDELNDTHPFLRLVETRTVALINKHHVTRIALIGKPL